MHHKSTILICVVFHAGSTWLAGQTVTLTVPASANAGLAGQPAGTAAGFDSAPINSPVEVRLPIVGGDELTINATGAAGSAQSLAVASVPPDGDSMPSYTAGSFGIAQIYGPQYSLIGVFLADSVDRQLVPPALRFTGALTTLERYSPMLQQPFFIGDGKAAAGVRQIFVAPAGATRLFLGILTSSTTYAKGAFQVSVAINDSRGYFPQVADGGGWKTTMLLYSTNRSESLYKLQLSKDDGTPFPVALAPGSSPLQGTIPAGGTAAIETADLSPNVIQGWALLAGTPGITGVAIFRQRTNGRPDLEASALCAGRERKLLVPYDQTEEKATGLAVLNPESSPQSITLTFREERGLSSGRAVITLPAGGHIAFALGSQQAPVGVPSAGRGVIEISAGTAQRVAALGLRFNPTGAFTSLPVSTAE